MHVSTWSQLHCTAIVVLDAILHPHLHLPLIFPFSLFTCSLLFICWTLFTNNTAITILTTLFFLSPSGMRVFKVSVAGGPVTFHVAPSPYRDGSRYFRVNESNGELYVKESLKGLVSVCNLFSFLSSTLLTAGVARDWLLLSLGLTFRLTLFYLS